MTTAVKTEHRRLIYGTYVSKNIQRDAVNWCQAQFGDRWQAVSNMQGTWCCFWAGPKRPHCPDDYHFSFANEQDLVLFILRWL